MEYLTQKKGFLGYDANHNNDPKVIIVLSALGER